MKAAKLDALKQFSLSLIRYSANLELAETSRFTFLFPRLLVVMIANAVNLVARITNDRKIKILCSGFRLLNEGVLIEYRITVCVIGVKDG